MTVTRPPAPPRPAVSRPPAPSRPPFTPVQRREGPAVSQRRPDAPRPVAVPSLAPVIPGTSVPIPPESVESFVAEPTPRRGLRHVAERPRGSWPRRIGGFFASVGLLTGVATLALFLLGHG